MQLSFGSRSPYLNFSHEQHFYYALGFLVRAIETKACKLVWETTKTKVLGDMSAVFKFLIVSLISKIYILVE